MPRLKKILKFLFLTGILCALVLFGIVLYSENTQDIAKADVMVVFGCQVMPSKVPSLTLSSRLDYAIELYEQGYAEHIIVSGGQGDNEPISEAACMKTYLIEAGIPEDVIFTEDQSTNTVENAKFSYEIMQEQGFESVLCVTTGSHRLRASWAMERAGAENVQSAGCESTAYEQWIGRFRECISLAKFFVQRIIPI